MSAVHDGVEVMPFGPLRSRVTSTVGLCLPAVLGVASTPVSGGFTRVALPRRAKGEVCRMSRSPVFFGARLVKQIRFSARALSARVERSVSRYGRPLSPPPFELLPALRAAARTPLPTTHHVAVLGAQSTFRR